MQMKPSRRSIKIKVGGTTADGKLKGGGREVKAQSFAKAVIFSLFLLLGAGIYVRWDSLLEMRNSLSAQSIPESISAVLLPSNQSTSEVVVVSENTGEEVSREGAKSVEKMKNRARLRKGNFAANEVLQSRSNEEKTQLNRPKKDAQLLRPGKVENVSKDNARFEISRSNSQFSLRSTSNDASKFEKSPDSKDVKSLLTVSASVSASVRGNLGPPSVVVSPYVSDWLKDRWQAAKDMSGDALKGPQWLQFDLPKPAIALNRILIDFETAWSKDYYIDIQCISSNAWMTVHDTRVAAADKTRTDRTKNHIVHNIDIDNFHCSRFSAIKFHIRRPATKFGTSIWRFEAYGRWEI